MILNDDNNHNECVFKKVLITSGSLIFGKQNWLFNNGNSLHQYNERQVTPGFFWQKNFVALLPIQLKQKRRVSGIINLFDIACPSVRLPITLP